MTILQAYIPTPGKCGSRTSDLRSCECSHDSPTGQNIMINIKSQYVIRVPNEPIQGNDYLQFTNGRPH